MSTTIDQPTIQSSPRAEAERTLRQQILGGTLPAGMRLPAEAKLAQRFGISRGTLRNALDTLQEEGLVKRRRNYGCVVAQRELDESLLSRTVTLISDAIGGVKSQLFSGHMASINSGIVDAAQAQGFDFMLIHAELGDNQVIHRLLDQRPFGVVVSSTNGDVERAAGLLQQLCDAGLPVVIHSDQLALQSFDRVVSDHEQGTAELMRVLAEVGRRHVLRVWCVPDVTPWWISAHNRGYDRASQEIGLSSIEPLHVPGLLLRDEYSRENFHTRVRQITGFLLEAYHRQKFDAIMVGTDSDVPIVAAACRLIGVEPGSDVVICGYDNYWSTMHERHWEPSIPFATVDKVNHHIGEQMVRLLLDRANGRLESDAQTRRVPQQVVRFHSDGSASVAVDSSDTSSSSSTNE